MRSTSILLRAFGVAALFASGARAEGYELSPVSDTPAGDRFLLAPDTHTAGHGLVALKAGVTHAYNPLLTTTNDSGPETKLVSSRLSFDLGASVTLVDRVLLALDVPFVAHQGSDYTNSPSSGGLSDLRLLARTRVANAGPVEFASELRLWLPTGSEDALASDGAARASIGGTVSGEVSRVTFAASLGYLTRERRSLGSVEFGPAIPFSAGVAFAPVPEFRVGPEIAGFAVMDGKEGFLSDKETPVVGLIGVHLRVGAIALHGGAGPGLSHAPGVSPRIMFGIAWEPERPRKSAAAIEPAAVPPEGHQDDIPKPAPVPTTPVVEDEPLPPHLMNLPPPPPPPPPPQRDDATIKAEARAEFTRGVQAFDAARYDEAVEAFAHAYALKPHIAVLRNLAHSELMSGRLKDACFHFVRWKTEVKDPSPADVKQANEGMKRACH